MHVLDRGFSVFQFQYFVSADWCGGIYATPAVAGCVNMHGHSFFCSIFQSFLFVICVYMHSSYLDVLASICGRCCVKFIHIHECHRAIHVSQEPFWCDYCMHACVAGAVCNLSHPMRVYLHEPDLNCIRGRSRPGAIIAGTWAGKMAKHCACAPVFTRPGACTHVVILGIQSYHHRFCATRADSCMRPVPVYLCFPCLQTWAQTSLINLASSARNLKSKHYICENIM